MTEQKCVDSALQCSSTVQQPDCLGEETVSESRGASTNTCVSPSGREKMQQAVSGMTGVLNDVMCFFLTACGVDVVKTG